MALLENLQLQTIDPQDDDEINGTEDSIDLRDPVNEGKLEKFWDQVVDDLHKDPDWYKFDD